jgi:hypothetical protein
MTCSYLLWAQDPNISPDLLEFLWPVSGWALLVMSVVGPCLWILASRRGHARPELRALGASASVIAAACGIALSLFQLHLEQPAVDGAFAGQWMGYEIEWDPATARVVVVGSIGRGFGRRFEAALAQAPDPVRIELSSGGGLVDEALHAARLLEARPGATVATHKVCASACLILLMAGHERTAEFDTSIDLHATGALTPTDNRLVKWNAQSLGEQADDYLNRRGVPMAMIAAANRAGTEKVLTISPREALDFGLLTAVTHKGEIYGLDRLDELPKATPRRLRAATEPPSPWDE